jgi:endonuclease/exonuclease/phosphatase family metal-dependent hydrolase
MIFGVSYTGSTSGLGPDRRSSTLRTPTMKIYSWNVLRSNKNVPEVCRFIKELDFDVLCLQEVTEEMLTQFKQMPFAVAYHVDRISKLIRPFAKHTMAVNYAVILSRHEILDEGKVAFPKLLRSFNSSVFEFGMGLIEKWESITNLGAVYADIEVKEKSIRIFSVHLALWNPKTRANEFEHLMEYLPEHGTSIVCGDFNILEYGPIKILNWFLSGSLYEGMPWYPERTLFEERFQKYNLTNPLLGHITHKFSRSQLDHILVSPSFKVTGAQVEKDSHGSDHQPVSIECELEKLSEAT